MQCIVAREGRGGPVIEEMAMPFHVRIRGRKRGPTRMEEAGDSFVRMRVFVHPLGRSWLVAENACFSTQMFSYRSDFNTMMEYVFGRIVVGTGKPN